jgi:hypothetical protein
VALKEIKQIQIDKPEGKKNIDNPDPRNCKKSEGKKLKKR